jgi:hypothetical protein
MGHYTIHPTTKLKLVQMKVASITPEVPKSKFIANIKHKGILIIATKRDIIVRTNNFPDAKI